MHAKLFLHSLLEKSSAIKHKSRLGSVLRGLESLLEGGKLSLSGIGRHRKGQAKVKNKLKSADYLLSNGHLCRERRGIYQAVSGYLLKGLKEIALIVDWSPCGKGHALLKASVLIYGSSLTVYEEVYPESLQGNYQIHQRFVARLKTFIPSGASVCVITDAGFRTEWFGLIQAQGWDYVGRIRANLHYQDPGETIFKPCLSLHEHASSKPQYYGEVYLSKTHPMSTHLFLYKGSSLSQLQPKKKPSKRGGKREQAYRKRAQEPWVLVSSCKTLPKEALVIVNLYRKRMKIEHEFRHTKDSQWGMGLAYSRTKEASRLEILLLMGYLALWLFWFIGLMAEKENKHYDYQANTVKKYRVLSLVFLGKQILLHEPSYFGPQHFNDIINQDKIV